MATIQKFVYGEGSGRQLEVDTVTVGAASGHGSVTFNGEIVEVVDVTLQSPATNIADKYAIMVQAIENQDPAGASSTGELTLDAFEMDVTATTPSWADSTGTGITSDLTYSVTVITQ